MAFCVSRNESSDRLLELGCETDVLYLLGVSSTKGDLEQKILSSDIVYVGGGNTLKMMSVKRQEVCTSRRGDRQDL